MIPQANGSGELEARLRFEEVLAELSSKFIHLAPDELDREIEEAQRRVCECLGLDVSTVWQVSPENPRLIRLTHLYRPLGGSPTPEQMDAREYFPWCFEQLSVGKVVAVSCMEELPPEASRDAEVWRHYGVKTALTIPLSAGGGPLIGAVSFNDIRAQRAWPGTLVKRLQLVGEVFGNALARKHSEQLLRESEARFRTVADSAPVLIWMSGTDKLCNFFNQGWLDFTGRTTEQESGHGWTEGVHPDELAGCMKIYIESFDARRPFTMEYRLRRHDGEYRWIQDTGVPRYDSERNFLGYIGSCVDLTERKQADERFRLVVEASPSGIVLVNRAGQIVLVNAETERLFGYAREELIGQAVEMLVPERYRGEHLLQRAEFFAAPQARAMGAGRELFARRKDGTEFAVEIGLSPIQTAEGTLVLTAIVDVTARKESEAEALRQRAELVHVARVSTMGELAASVSHELNQPLGAILANAEAAELFINEDPPALDEVRAILTDIRKDDERAGEVIRRMRGLLRRHELDREPLEINSVVEDVLQVVSADASLRKMAVGADLAPVLPNILGDRVYLQQVLLNLILNGMDAMADQPRERRRVVVRTRRSEDGGVEVAVIDGGHGIEPDKLPRLFEPFFTTKPNGMGMGLSISRTIIAAHRGRIWAENNPARGAIFLITLPVIS
jgi:PAS domain S-box-containing protein